MYSTLKKGFLTALFLVGAGQAFAAGAEAPAKNQQPPCAACHKDATNNYMMSRHAVSADARTPGNNCATCHGETLRHMSNPVKEKPQYVFKKDAKGFMDDASRAAADKVCTSCHKASSQKHWMGSAHEQAQVGCVSCHSSHKADVALNKKTTTALCLSCHADQKSKLFKTATHPVLSGQMSCVSCHNPHGTKAGGVALMKKDSVNETCFTCHPGKRGPFVYAHQPVTENCANCHDTHGTNRSQMLKMNEPMLCQSCHAGAHLGIGTASAGQAKMVRAGCTSCHNKVHGSNATSALDRSGGKYGSQALHQ